MFVDDYTPMKRIGIEELEGCVRLFGEMEDERSQGAHMALHLILVGRFKYPADFVGVWKAKCAEVYGREDG